MDDELRGIKEVINGLSHDIHGIVGILRIKSNMLSKIVPGLVENYHSSKEQNIVQKGISEGLLDNIDDLLALDEQLSEILTLVDSVKDSVNDEDRL